MEITIEADMKFDKFEAKIDSPVPSCHRSVNLIICMLMKLEWCIPFNLQLIPKRLQLSPNRAPSC